MKTRKRIRRLLAYVLALAVVLGIIPISEVKAEDISTRQASVQSADDLLLYPAPRSMTAGNGIYTLSAGQIKSDDENLKAVDKICRDVSELANVSLTTGSGTVVVDIQKDDTLDEQGYSLVINESGVKITYKDADGAYYAAATLYQILWQAKTQLPYLSIVNDHPDFKIRAFDMDISRNRLPSVETVKRIIDQMANLKYNQMFLYLEGFSYAYGSYPQVWSGGDPMTPAQVRELSEYAAEKGIDLIPAQNSFGHSYQWIGHNDFKELGDTDNSTTFNVFDPRTQEFLSNIYDDLFTDGFQTDYLQVGGDETSLDLANGRAAASWKELNPGKEPTQSDLYMDSMEIIYNLSKEKGKQMLYWGDMIIHYDLYDQVKEIMPDAIAMDWGYLYDYNFDKGGEKFSEAGIPYYVCAGDSSWSTIVGNTYVMNKNAEAAAESGKKYGALGYCMTNWGDAGHYQNIITTYPAIVYAGGLSWCSDTNRKEVNSYDDYLNMFLYQDSTNTLSQAFSELADFSNNYLPYGWNGNWIANSMVESWTSNGNSSKLWEFMDFQENGNDGVINETVRDKALAQCEQVAKAATDFIAILENTDIRADDKDILYKEFKNTAQMTKIAADYAAMRLRLFTGGDIAASLTTEKKEKETAIQNAQEFQEMIEDFKYIWKERDVFGELLSTLGWISKPAMMYRDIAGVSNIYKPQEDGNLFLMTPDTVGTKMSIDNFVVNGWTWTNYGTGMAAIAVTRIGSESVGQLKKMLDEKIFSVVDNMEGADGNVFVYDSKAAIDGKYYDDNPTWGPLLPRFRWPALVPYEGTYTITARMKYESGRPINAGTVATNGGANRVSNGALADFPENPQWTVSDPDENGWCEVTLQFYASDVAAAAVDLIPQNNVQDDKLYVTDMMMKVIDPKIVITSDHDAYTSIKLGTRFVVPDAESNGTEPVTITLKNPDGTESEVNIGDSVLANEAGMYRLTYSAADVKEPLVIIFEVESDTSNLFIINDDNATGFIPSQHFFSISNPYYEGNNGFNADYKLVVYGNDTQDTSQYASIVENVEGGNGQVILLDTANLTGSNRVPLVNFAAKVEPGKKYYMSVRMKLWRGDMAGGMDLGPFQTTINYFNSEITDQANENFSGYHYFEEYLDETQKELAKNGEWFTFEREFTVPDTVTINGAERVPTAMNVFFMTSSREEDADQHKMWVDDVTLYEVKEIAGVTAIEDMKVAYGKEESYLLLPEKAEVTLADGSAREVEVTWGCDNYDPAVPGTYTFTGELVLPKDISNPENKTASLNVIVKEKENNLILINDETANAFIPSQHFFALVNPYYEANHGFNKENKLVAYGNDTQDTSAYASLVYYEDGANGQAILLDTQNLKGSNRVPAVNFCAEVEAGKTYHFSMRMKYWRADMEGGMDLGPFQTVTNYFNSGITDQAGDNFGGYQMVSDMLDSTQRSLAGNGEWFTLEREFTVPETVTINGQETVPTAVNMLFMTSSRDTDDDQHKMWIDDVVLTKVEMAEGNIAEAEKLDDVEVAYGKRAEYLPLPGQLTVTMDNGGTRDLAVTWECADYNAKIPGTYTFTGTFTLPNGVKNPDNVTAVRKIIVKEKAENLITINDDTADAFIPTQQFFALTNPYYEGNKGFNDENQLVAYGNDTQDTSKYASLVYDAEGGHGQVVLLDTQNLTGSNRLPDVNFCAEVEAGKTYRLTTRMKFWRGEMAGGMDLGPFQTSISYFNSGITDQANENFGGYLYISDFLSAEQKELAANGEWFTYEREFTVPETVTIGGAQRVPTAINVFYMTSSRAEDADQHKMWIDDVVLVEVVEEHEHDAVKTEAKEATCTEDGNIAYWYCEGCDTYFSDEACTNEITLEETVVAKNPDNHTGSHDVVKNKTDATYDNDGYTGDIYWSCCDTLYEKGKVIPKLERPADYSKVNEAKAAAGALNRDLYKDLSAVDAAVAAVEEGKMSSEQDAVDAMAKAINDAIAALELKDADYTKVDEAIAKAEALNKDDYKDFSAVEAAVNAVVRGKNITEQAEVDAMAKAINDAAAALKYKDADYTKVDEAIAKAEALNKDDYKDFSAVEAAINAVVRGKNITEQAEVDAMAKAIEDAAAGLEKKEPPLPQELPYKDVNKGDWFYDYVYDVYVKELMTGLTETVFAPNNNIVRAQFAVIVYRMEGQPEVTFKDTFPDVKDGNFYSDAVIWAAENGIVTGYTNTGLFGPNDPITREQMAAMMFRYANYKELDTDAREDLNAFPDENKVQEFATDAVKWCVAEGIISGKGEEGAKSLDPQGNTVRAEAATIISRYTEAVK